MRLLSKTAPHLLPLKEKRLAKKKVKKNDQTPLTTSPLLNLLGNGVGILNNVKNPLLLIIVSMIFGGGYFFNNSVHIGVDAIKGLSLSIDKTRDAIKDDSLKQHEFFEDVKRQNDELKKQNEEQSSLLNKIIDELGERQDSRKKR